ncbi:CD1375 family protein [Cohnella cellulosilytica]|uniref:CD1375 family protein n=1 Tax=Cohnella cellulosilytica TaxID=986710 RepID=A0ABW2FA58_9BACL
MAKVYYGLIKAGVREIGDVPTRWRADVQTMLDADTQDSAT